MTDLIFYYTVGAITVSNLIVVWNLTNLPVHFYDILNYFNKNKEELYTREDWENYIALNHGTLGELIVCPMCLATHLSWAVGLAIYLIQDCSPFLILVGTFSWPMISYLFLKLAK